VFFDQIMAEPNKTYPEKLNFLMGAGPLVWTKKIVSFQFSPYELTAFLDGDTCFCGSTGTPTQ
jgi:hypothetical protein